jgi:hypothetical protein
VNQETFEPVPIPEDLRTRLLPYTEITN